MLRRLHHTQPEAFAFTPENLRWAEAQISKYPEGRQASAVIPLLWRAQEQEGWLSRPAIEHVADMLGMAHIRVLEVATFYFMFQLAPVGRVAHVQVCGTTSCMLCGAEDLVAVCREKIAPRAHQVSEDGRFSWEEVECLGACANAPMAQIGKDYYEDLTAERLAWLLDEFAAGRVPVPGPQNGRYSCEPLGGLTSLTEFDSGRTQYNASAQRAVDLGDTIRRIDGTEMPITTPWRDGPARPAKPAAARPKARAEMARVEEEETPGTPAPGAEAAPQKPALSAAPPETGADDLKLIKGVGPGLEAMLNEMGVWTFAQVAAWSAAEVAWIDTNMVRFKGRASRDDWVGQAKILAAGGQTAFSERAARSEDG